MTDFASVVSLDVTLANGDPVYGVEVNRQAFTAAATLYDVMVSFQEESRTYKAVALWLPPEAPDWSDWGPEFVDHVVKLTPGPGTLVLQHLNLARPWGA